MRLESARNQTMSLFMTKKDNTVGTNMTVLFEKDSSYGKERFTFVSWSMVHMSSYDLLMKAAEDQRSRSYQSHN